MLDSISGEFLRIASTVASEEALRAETHLQTQIIDASRSLETPW